MMTSCYNVGQLRSLALCIQGLPLGYRSVSLLAKGEAEGLIYVTRSSLKGRNKLPPLRVGVANHHGKKDTRGEFIRPNNGGCKNFCVNGHLAGNCLTSRRSEHDRSKESPIAGFDRPTAGRLPEARRPDRRARPAQATDQGRCGARPASRDGRPPRA